MKKKIYFAGVISGIIIGTVICLLLDDTGIGEVIVISMAFAGFVILALLMISVLVDMKNEKRKATRTPTPIPWDKRLEMD